MPARHPPGWVKAWESGTVTSHAEACLMECESRKVQR